MKKLIPHLAPQKLVEQIRVLVSQTYQIQELLPSSAHKQQKREARGFGQQSMEQGSDQHLRRTVEQPTRRQ